MGFPSYQDFKYLPGASQAGFHKYFKYFPSCSSAKICAFWRVNLEEEKAFLVRRMGVRMQELSVPKHWGHQVGGHHPASFSAGRAGSCQVS